MLGRAHLTKQLAVIGRTPAQVLADHAAAVDIVVPGYVPKVSRDPDDDQVLACALTAQADAIVSGDADLLDLKNFQGIPIHIAAQAVERVTGEK